MEIEDVKKAKRQCEQEIGDIIERFERCSGCKVDSAHVDRVMQLGRPDVVVFSMRVVL